MAAFNPAVSRSSRRCPFAADRHGNVVAVRPTVTDPSAQLICIPPPR
jgi:hypothetical protein